jgi:hypothetical protein
VEQCSLFLEEILSFDTWQLVWETGVTYNLQSLVDTVEHFILDYLYDILDCASVSVTELEKKFEARAMTAHLEKLRAWQNHNEHHMLKDCTLMIAIPVWTSSCTEISPISCYSEATNNWMELTTLPPGIRYILYSHRGCKKFSLFHRWQAPCG